MNQEEGPHPDYAGGFVLDSPASRTGREKFLLFLSYPVSVIAPEWMKTLTFLWGKTRSNNYIKTERNQLKTQHNFRLLLVLYVYLFTLC